MSDCIFCKIVNNEIPSKKISENDKAVAFLDLYPVSLGHTIVIPKKHFDSFSECDDEYLCAVSKLAKQVANTLKEANLGIEGFNYLSNEKAIAGQVINHYHFHVIPKYKQDKGFKTQHIEDEFTEQQNTILNSLVK